MPIEFKGSEGFTLGVEEEFQIVDASTGELVPKAEEVMSRLPEDLAEHISYELFLSVVETKTPVCASVPEVHANLRELRNRLGSWVAACGASLASAGTHPFSRYQDQEITPQQRYLDVVERLQWVARREVIMGQHIHVSVPDAHRSIEATNRLAEYAPLLLALSANSPFWHGALTGFESTRIKVFDGFPRAGLPPEFGSWEDFERYVEKMVAAGAIEDYTFCWWDVRPHAKFGTVEVRIPDAQTRLEPAVALTALIQCLVARAVREAPETVRRYDRDLTSENKWRAARYGMEAVFYDFGAQESVPAKEMARRLVDELRPLAAELGCESELCGILDIVEQGTGSRRQRRIYEESGDLLEVVADLIEGTRPALAET
ncbi:glutamate--cysteine ligase [Rubrobacter taiwanensis]|jgi:carboxylate-amine ligase|uniref:Putative glutamate--cysteine ligase 2 n=1 Tax=Rubrobacter taiwanensis TaxID=185139 RepID=A0A4R1BFH0_9ACTN|nr:glutamate--cysteine ligase [Rubrobacter taiwanensis]TCJ15883.1 glutamate--cysteine ligase [Rubrobacter taiwanensis]